jgi:Family of unknown function (DUF5683)
MIRNIGLVCFLLLSWAGALAQEKEKRDSTVTPASDSVLIESKGPIENIDSYSNRYDPHRALMLAAVLPGSGQIYTKKYWKLPLVYGGLGLLTYSVIFYQKEYNFSKGQLFDIINSGDPNATSPKGYTETQLRSIVDETRRQRDFFLIMDGLLYILQIVDAHVDAHLKEFDLNPRLRARVEPHIEKNNLIGKSTGFALILKF